MKLPSSIVTCYLFTFIIVLIQYVHPVVAGDFKKGDVVVIDTPSTKDLYVSSQKLIIKAPIGGDLYAAAQSISIDNHIDGDLVTVSETIDLQSNLNDDFRAAARIVNINSSIKGDVLLFANEVYIGKGSTIDGDLTVYAGSLFCEGTIKGSVIIKGGTISLSGPIDGLTKVEGGKLTLNSAVNGKAEITAQRFSLGPDARFNNNVRYWKEGGAMKVSPNVHSGKFEYDNSLAKQQRKKSGSFQSSFLFFIWHSLFAILMFVLLTYLWPVSFQSSGVFLAKTPLKSLGYGIAYFVVFPITIFLLFLSIIGIPIAVLLFFLYLFSITCGLVITSLALSNYASYKLQRHWSKWMVIGISILIFLVLHLILLIPFIGFLVVTVLTCAAYGGLILKFIDKRQRTRLSY